MKRGRPKAHSSDDRSFGPLGDLIRSQRLARGLGLADVAQACRCSVQFVSNIEHGRAPLPWEKVDLLAGILDVPAAKLQAANLAVRSDFRTFVGATSARGRRARGRVKSGFRLTGNTNAASAVALAARDSHLQEVLRRYETASQESRKRFLRAAAEMLQI